MKISAKKLEKILQGDPDYFFSHLKNPNREKCLPPRQVDGEDRWVVPGEHGAITGTSLREQRGYHQEVDGSWTRFKGGSTNSIRG